MNNLRNDIAEKSLYTLIVTRPQRQSAVWVKYLMQHNIDYQLFPALEINALYTKWDMRQSQMLMNTDILIITSANCIYSAPLALVQQLRHAAFKIVTLGQGTSHALLHHDIQPFLTAPDGATSESLLALPFFCEEKIDNKKIVILSGRGGRGHLEEVLQERHARVHKIELYQRICPASCAPEVLQAIQHCSKPIFIITSQEALMNIMQLLPEKELPWLKAQLFVLVSERILEYAKTLGFTKLWNARSLTLEKIHAFIEARLSLV